MWHKPSWRRSPLAPTQNCWADDPQNAEQLYQGNSCTVKKVLGPTTDFRIWGSGKGTENPQEIWLWCPVGDWTRLACECPAVSSGGVGQQFGLRSNNREGTQPPPSTENWIKDLLSIIPLIRTRPTFPHSQSLPSRSFHKPLTLIHRRADRMKTTITKNET